MKYLSTFILAVLVATAGLQAGESVHEERPLSADGVVEIDLLSGSLRLIGWDEEKVEVSGTLAGGADQLEVKTEEEQSTVSISSGPSSHGGMPYAELEVRVPSKCRVEVQTVSASIKTTGLAGRVSIESVSGNIDIQGSPREAKLSSVSGAITIEGDASLQEGAVETVSGSIDMSVGIHPRARLEVETVSGTIDMHVPEDAPAEFEAETFSGDIENEMGPGPKRTDSMLPSKELSFSTGEGGARISLSSFSGVIRIHKASKS